MAYEASVMETEDIMGNFLEGVFALTVVVLVVVGFYLTPAIVAGLIDRARGKRFIPSEGKAFTADELRELRDRGRFR